MPASPDRHRRPVGLIPATAAAAGLIFLLSLLSPVQMVESDPAVMLLAGQAIIDHHTLRLDGFRGHPDCSYDLDRDYRVKHQGDSLYYYSYGATIASLPAVLVANQLGLHMLDQEQEFVVQNLVSALLTALAFVLLVELGRVLAGPWAGLVIALVTTLGSSLTSTLATGLWTSCYQVVLITLALLLVTRYEGGRRRHHLIGVAGVLGLAFVIRPSTAFLILAFGLASRDIPKRVRVLGLICAAIAIIAGLLILGPEGATRYYSPRRLMPHTPLLTGLYGTLLSPSRGLFVFSPFLVVVVVVCLWQARSVLTRPGVSTVVTWIVLHTLAVSTRGMWWGGHSFGPRLMTDLLPGFALLAGCAWHILNAPRPHPRRWLAAALYLGLAVPAMLINSYQGLFNQHSKRWNSDPKIDRHAALIFSWRYPQFLASEDQIEHRRFALQCSAIGSYQPGSVLSHDSSDLAFLGWYGAEGEWRWSRGNQARLLLRLPAIEEQSAFLLELTAGALGQQRVGLTVNGQEVGTIGLAGFEAQHRLAVIPPGVLQGGDTEIVLDIPEATTTAADSRRLGVALRSLRLSPLARGLPPMSFANDKLFVAGFSHAEAGWRWSDGHSATIACPVAEIDDNADHALELIAGALAEQRVVIRINGTAIGTLELSGQEPQRSLLVIPAGVLGSYRVNTIELELPDAHPVASDPRQLGLAFISATLH